jgi:outer membrane protein insertion porin family
VALRRIGLILLAAAMLPAAAASAGQTAAPPPAVVAKITVLMDGGSAPQAFRDLIPIAPGDAYSPMTVDRVVKQIYQTGLFADVNVVRSGEEKIELTFSLTRNLLVRRVYFVGVGVKTSGLDEALEVFRPGSVFSEDRMPKAVDELKEALRQAGYFDAAVNPITRTDPKEARIDLYFRISGWKRYRIGSLHFIGTTVVPVASLEKKMKSRKGRDYVPSELSRDIQSLETYYASIGYPRSDIRLDGERFDPEGGTVALELRIEPGEKITIIINGAKVPKSLLAPIWQERIFEEWGLSEGEVRILSNLRKKGYVYATLKSRIERPDDEIRVIYDVTPGRKYRIEKVSFEGAKAFSPGHLEEEMAVTEKVLFFSLLSYDRLFAIPRALEYFYQVNGFPEARVDLELKRTETGVDAVFKINEGPQQIIQSISFEGVNLISPQAILKDLVDVRGGPLFAPNVQRDVGIIENLYLNHGVRGTKITPRVEPLGDNRFALKFAVEEGRVVTIRSILITGHRSTRTSVIRKEIRVKAGEPADMSLIQETKRRLERLGIFSEVRIDEIPTDTASENLVIAVLEGEKNYVGLGIGFETVDAVRSLALWDSQYRIRGTGEYIRSNALGTAAQVSLVGQYSLIEKRAIVSWTQPYLFGLALRPSLLGWIEAEDLVSYAYDRRGFSFNTVRQLGRSNLLLTTLSWTRTILTKLDIPESDVDRRLQPYSTALLSVSLVRDRRDDSLNPERGYFLSGVAQLAAPILGTESDYWKGFFKFQYFHPLTSRVPFGLTARAGIGSGLISIPERFFAGGANSFRGEEFDRLGPKDPASGNPVGGKALFVINAELGFPIIPALRDLSGVGFYDLGNVFAELKDFRIAALESAAGFGIRYKTPLGPVRFELAWKLGAPDPARGRKPLFFITIGNMF